MKIYGIGGFPNPARVRSAHAEKGATDNVGFVPVDVVGGGTHISQCNAITGYIDSHFEGPLLTGTTSKQHAQISMMNLRVENSLLNVVGAYFHHATPGLGAGDETYQCVERGTKQIEVAGQTMAYIDVVLADNDFLARSEFSVADITAFAGLSLADFAKVEIPRTLPHLAAWHAKVAARPSIAA